MGDLESAVEFRSLHPFCGMPASLCFERSGFAFLSEGAHRFGEVLCEMKLETFGLDGNFVRQSARVPATNAHSLTHPERRIFHDLGCEFCCDGSNHVSGSKAGHDPRSTRLFGTEEAPVKLTSSAKAAAPRALNNAQWR